MTGHEFLFGKDHRGVYEAVTMAEPNTSNQTKQRCACVSRDAQRCIQKRYLIEDEEDTEYCEYSCHYEDEGGE